MGAIGEYARSKTNGGAVLEGNGRAAKGEEENDMKDGVRTRCFLDDCEPSRRHVCCLDHGVLFL